VPEGTIVKDETLAPQEFDPESATSIARDPLWTKTVRLFMERNKSYRHTRDQTRQGIALTAAIFLQERSRWQQFQRDCGIDRPRRGPVSRSIFTRSAGICSVLASVATLMAQPL
jgi:hypothetical protein